MPIQNPSAAIQFPGFLSPTSALQSWEGLLHPSYLKGGFQSVTTLAERNAISIWQEGNALTHAGFSESGDGGYTTGRRSIGMLVYVLENNKFYTLCPKGYFVNPVDENTPAGGETEWQALSEWVKAGLLKPNSTGIYDDQIDFNTFQPTLYTPPSTDANDPWVELTFGGVAGISYNPADGLLTITDSAGETFSTPINSGNLFKFKAPTSTYYSIDEDADYLGGSAANQNPTIYVTRGETYTFRREEAGHPLEIRDGNGNAVTAGTRAGANPINGAGAVWVWQVPHDAAPQYTYHCTAHQPMNGIIKVQASAGLSGVDGAEGPVGPAGSSGTSGSSGSSGQDGAAGLSGVDGQQGPQGDPGTSGSSGSSGSSG